jgi:hypothetical protein
MKNSKHRYELSNYSTAMLKHKSTPRVKALFFVFSNINNIF